MLPDPEVVDFVPGDATGLPLPAHPAALEHAGATWLTQALRAYGAIAPDNAVVRIVDCVPGWAGNSGEKLFLSVEYARPEPGLHCDLFVKFSRFFADAFRDRRRFELEAEVRLAALSRLPGFPVHVAKPYFADFHRATGTGLLVTQQIAFGENGIEPLRAKNMDHELANPLEYYRATVTALARLAAAHAAGRLSPVVEELFPFDGATALSEMQVPWSREELAEKVAAIGAFVKRCPWVLLDKVDASAFLARFACDVPRIAAHRDAIMRFLYADPRFIALTHWNTHIDNAWFWRDGAGVLQCGLLDWGMVRPMNFTIGLWGGHSGAPPGFLDRHIDGLLAVFLRELAANGGPRIAADECRLHFDLSVAVLGVAMLIDAPALILSRLPQAVDAKGLTDPLLRRDQVGQGFLHTFAAWLGLWARNDFGAALDRLLAVNAGLPKGAWVGIGASG
jgi:hypothetical protein